MSNEDEEKAFDKQMNDTDEKSSFRPTHRCDYYSFNVLAASTTETTGINFLLIASFTLISFLSLIIVKTIKQKSIRES